MAMQYLQEMRSAGIKTTSLMLLAVYMTIQAIAQTQKSIPLRKRSICAMQRIYELLVKMGSGMVAGRQMANSFMMTSNPME